MKKSQRKDRMQVCGNKEGNRPLKTGKAKKQRTLSDLSFRLSFFISLSVLFRAKVVLVKTDEKLKTTTAINEMKDFYYLICFLFQAMSPCTC